MFDYQPARHRAGRTALVRRYDGELAQLDQRTDLAEEHVAGINRVAQRAMFETMMTGLIRREAERIAPDQTEVYAMISMAAGMGSVRVINSMYRR